jgi:hypothetical protein
VLVNASAEYREAHCNSYWDRVGVRRGFLVPHGGARHPKTGRPPTSSSWQFCMSPVMRLERHRKGFPFAATPGVNSYGASARAPTMDAPIIPAPIKIACCAVIGPIIARRGGHDSRPASPLS